MFQRMGVSGVSTLFVFGVLPILEIVALIQLGGSIGVLNTLLLLVGLSALGFWMLRRRVTALVHSATSSTSAAQGLAKVDLPAAVAKNGLGVLGAILLIIPGLITGAAGLVLQIAPVRIALARLLGSRLQTTVNPIMRQSRRFTGEVIDVDSYSPQNPRRSSEDRPNSKSPRLLGEHPDAS